MILYLVRHGQSEGNIVTYDVPDGRLTPLGRQQAEETARRLAEEGLDLLISSPLRRALETALATQARTGLPLEVWQRLWEYRDLEPAQFLGRRGVLELCPGALCDDDLPQDGFECGWETPETAFARARDMFDRIRRRFGATDQKVAIFAHGTFNAFLLMAMMGRPWQPGLWIEQRNCCINRIHIDPQHVRILGINDVAHLSTSTI
ncbi:histidine phosphatase family protein [Symbiobacterium terraclitae]|uniref:histidine phosphatase family protein n=1 Tax=Symbiobacterium terraclitae TaxID=557451 RepID=UPI0035B54DFD